MIVESYQIRINSNDGVQVMGELSFDFAGHDTVTKLHGVNTLATDTLNLPVGLQELMRVEARERTVSVMPKRDGSYQTMPGNALNMPKTRIISKCLNTYKVPFSSFGMAGSINGHYVFKYVCADPQYIGEFCNQCKSEFGCSNNSAMHSAAYGFSMLIAVIAAVVVVVA